MAPQRLCWCRRNGHTHGWCCPIIWRATSRNRTCVYVNPSRLAQLKVTPHVGRRATSLDTNAQQVTLDNGMVLEYDDLLIATGSSAVRAPVPGADGAVAASGRWIRHVVLSGITAGTQVVMVGRVHRLYHSQQSSRTGAKLSIVEIAPQILPRMIDRTGAEIVAGWLQRHGVEIRRCAFTGD